MKRSARTTSPGWASRPLLDRLIDDALGGAMLEAWIIAADLENESDWLEHAAEPPAEGPV